MSTVATVILINFLVISIPIFISHSLASGSKAAEVDRPENRVFRVSKLLRVVLLLSAAMGATFIFWGFQQKGLDWIILFAGIGSFFLFGSLFEYFRLSKSFVQLFDDSITYKKGKKRTTVEFAEIRNVDCDYGQIIIDTGDKWKVGIPIYFSGSARILSILKQAKERYQSDSLNPLSAALLEDE